MSSQTATAINTTDFKYPITISLLQQHEPHVTAMNVVSR